MGPTSCVTLICSPSNPPVPEFRPRPCRAATASTEAFSCLIDSRGACTIFPAQKTRNAPAVVPADRHDLEWIALVLAGRVLDRARALLRRRVSSELRCAAVRFAGIVASSCGSQTSQGREKTRVQLKRRSRMSVVKRSDALVRLLVVLLIAPRRVKWSSSYQPSSWKVRKESHSYWNDPHCRCTFLPELNTHCKSRSALLNDKLFYQYHVKDPKILVE